MERHLDRWLYRISSNGRQRQDSPAFAATGTVIGSNIQSSAITGVANLDATNSFVKGTFYGKDAAALGGLTVIKTTSGQHSDLFVTCRANPHADQARNELNKLRHQVVIGRGVFGLHAFSFGVVAAGPGGR